MKDGLSNSTALLLTATVSFLHISAFIAWSIYQEHRINDISGIVLTNKEKLVYIDNVRQLIADTGDGQGSGDQRRKRDTKDVDLIKALLEKQRDNFVDIYLNKVEQHTKEIFKEYADFLHPSSRSGSVRVARAGTTSDPTSGNEMAQIFQQLAQSEIAIFDKYCQNSTICLPGPKGEPGTKGEIGHPGLKGEPGVQGPSGVMGIPGMQGAKGEPGAMGMPGQKGEQGNPGLPGKPGPAGIKGDQGDRGVPGSIGFPGQKGDKGPRGESGPAGVPGLKGDKGDKGDTGQQGIKGDIGQQGPRGQDGAAGIPGEKGEKGEQGEVRDLRPTTPCCDLLERPNFSKTEETIKALEGTKVYLTCNPSGHPAVSISWSPKDPATMVQQGNDIEISNVDVSQAGKYICTAQNVLGSASKTYNLQVYKHLKIKDPITNHTLLEGQNVVFECKFSGTPTPNITWYHNNPDGTRTQINSGVSVIPGGSQLELYSVSRANKGEYTCEADNGLEKLSQHAYLTTQGPPVIIPQPTVTALVGETRKLHCEALGDPKPTTTWSSPPNVNNAYEDKNGDLVLMNVQKGDAGRYICKATNPLGTDSAAVQLIVKAPGHVQIAGKVNKVTNNTRTVGLDCTATGEEPLTVQWYHDGKPVVRDQNHLILSGNTLLILNVKQPDDLGEYMCVASNQYGSDNKTALIYDDNGKKSCSDKFGTCQVICGAECPAGCFSVGYTGTKTYDTNEDFCDSAIKSGAIPPSGGMVVWKQSGSKSTILVS